MCIDISRIGEADTQLTAAAMLAAWSDGLGTVAASHALADAGLAPRRWFFTILDELWRPLRAASGIVDRIDALTRLNRSLGLGDAKITHTLKDAEALGSDSDRAKARGFVERAGIVACAGLPMAEMEELGRVVGMSRREIELVSSWSSPPGWASTGTNEEPPGRGRFLIKVGGRPGIPIRVTITDTERRLHDTNLRWVQNGYAEEQAAERAAARMLAFEAEAELGNLVTQPELMSGGEGGRREPFARRSTARRRPVLLDLHNHGVRQRGDLPGGLFRWHPRRRRDRQRLAPATADAGLVLPAGLRADRGALAERRAVRGLRRHAGVDSAARPAGRAGRPEGPGAAGPRQGLAGAHELASLAPAGIAARARELRPSLAGLRDLPPDERGNLLGDLMPNGPELRSSYEDVELDLMAPRAGKSTGIAVPRVLRARGAVLLTSNKSDVYSVTRAERERIGTVWTFDPQGIAHTRREMWWDMLAECVTIEGARRLAGHFVASVNDDTTKKDFWISAAQNTLTALFLAAARRGATVSDLLGWLADPADRTPVDLLRDAGMSAMAEQLQGTVRGAVETRTASTRRPASAWPACSIRRFLPGCRTTRICRSSARTCTCSVGTRSTCCPRTAAARRPG
ncbi:type IV secretory system conjugative DNA transfer family protein [Micromonospora sp. M12]